MEQFRIEPAKTALVIIDLQNAVLSREPAPHTAAQVVENSRKLAEAFRSKAATVVYVRVDINDFLQLPVDKPSRMGNGPFPPSLSEIAPSAGFQPGDMLITKRHRGAFAGSGLDEQLRTHGVDTVVLTGISTNHGVESTLRQGTGLGYAFITVEDACSGLDAEQHRFAVTNIFPRLSRVRSASDVLAALA